MRLLCSLALGLVLAWLVVLLTWVSCDLLGDGIESLVGEVHRVGTHIGDVSGLIEGLR